MDVENRLIIGEDMNKSKVPCFHGSPCKVGLLYYHRKMNTAISPEKWNTDCNGSWCSLIIY